MNNSSTGDSGLGQFRLHVGLFGATQTFFGVVMGVSPMSSWWHWLWAAGLAWHAYQIWSRRGKADLRERTDLDQISSYKARGVEPRVAELLAELEESGRGELDTAEVATASIALQEARERLQLLLAATSRDSLEERLGRLKMEANSASAEELSSVQERLERLNEAEETLGRLDQESRVLIDQLEALRLAAASFTEAEYSERSGPAVRVVQEELTRVQEEVEAAHEVERFLSH